MNFAGFKVLKKSISLISYIMSVMLFITVTQLFSVTQVYAGSMMSQIIVDENFESFMGWTWDGGGKFGAFGPENGMPSVVDDKGSNAAYILSSTGIVQTFAAEPGAVYKYSLNMRSQFATFSLAALDSNSGELTDSTSPSQDISNYSNLEGYILAPNNAVTIRAQIYCIGTEAYADNIKVERLYNSGSLGFLPDKSDYLIGEQITIEAVNMTNPIIYYTTDGSNPRSSASRTEYTGSYTVPQNDVNLRAVAYESTVAGGGFQIPTEIFSKQVNVAGVVKDVTSNYSSGVYGYNIPVTLTNSSGGSIYYTKDGSDPKTSSSRSLYTGTFTIENSCTIRAYAEKAGMTDGNISEYQYRIVDDVLGFGLNWQRLNGWERWPMELVTYTDENVHGAGLALTVLPNGAGGGRRGAALAPETTYLLTGWGMNEKIEQIPSSASIIYKQKKSSIDPDNPPDEVNYETGTDYADVTVRLGFSENSWTRKSKVFTTPKASDFADCYLLVYKVSATAVFYLDDVSLSVVAPLENVTSSHSSGVIKAGTRVSLTSADFGASIYYTEDGTDPKSIPQNQKQAHLYSAPITVNSDITIRAYAEHDDYAPSATSAFNYTIMPFDVSKPYFELTGGGTADCDTYTALPGEAERFAVRVTNSTSAGKQVTFIVTAYSKTDKKVTAMLKQSKTVSGGGTETLKANISELSLSPGKQYTISILVWDNENDMHSYTNMVSLSY